jgi:hypothetical protein
MPGALLLLLAVPPAAPADEALFRERIAPLLHQRCLSCHNADRHRGGLDLSDRMTLLKGSDNGSVVTPGQAERSLLLKAVSGSQPRMPKQGPKLTSDEVAVLRRWIDAGSAWPDDVKLTPPKLVAEDWWSLRPLSRPAPPAVKVRSRLRTPIDAFIVARLEKEGLHLAPEADRLTLLRRVTFDLTGLPPTPQEIDDFLNDNSPDAYEKVVDRLLASPRYGERWGRHWLDLVHYADTHGYDKDKRRDAAWPYRDYVIRAFNDDKPYPRFIREQLAGDVLFPNDPDGVVATGFIAAGPWDFVGHVELREGTVEKEKTRLLDRDDMVMSTAATFFSLTVGCARCHDHKFDPITQKDYYRLQAVFAGVERGNRPYPDAARQEKLARLEMRRRDAEARHAALLAKAAARPELQRLDAALAEARKELAALPTPAGPSPSNGWHSGISATPDVVKWVQVDLGKSVPLDVVRLVPARPTDFRDAPGFGFPLRFRVEASDEPTFKEPVVLADHAATDFPNPGDRPFVVRPEGKKARYVRVMALRLWQRTNDYVFALAELEVESDGKNVARSAAVTSLDSIEAGRWSRKYLVDGFESRRRLPDLNDPDGAETARRRSALEVKVQTLEKERQVELDRGLSADDRAALSRCIEELLEVKKETVALPETTVYAVVPQQARPIFILHRGDVEQKRAEVGPGAVAAVPGLTSEFAVPAKEGDRRVALADWIADPKNPLTWRAAVNRVWHWHFGRGIVDTPADFGRNGSLPTHPELLDWLAVEFREGGSFKKLHRLILTSSVYRQSSRHDAAAAKVDADNRLLWRMNRTRLDAEEIRDSVLAISGDLDLRMGGPGYEAFRFKDDHSPIYDHADLQKIHDPATFRRTVYRFTVRSVPNPLLECLDCADPNINTPARNTTLTALQALALLNDPFLVRRAERFAARLEKASDDPEKRMELACRLALGRPPTDEERTALTAHVRKHGLAATCRLLFNLNEFVFID